MQLPADLRKWLEAQVERGCHPEDMINALVGAGYALDMAKASVAQILREPRKGSAWIDSTQDIVGSSQANVEMAGAHGHAQRKVPQPLSLPLANGEHVIQATDRKVRVAASLARPSILVFDGLLSDDECDALIETARPNLKRSHTINRASGSTELNVARTSSGTYFHHNDSPLLARINHRIADVTRWPLENGEPLQILHYPAGAQYEPHYDYFDPADPGTPKLTSHGGHRVATLIIYLNDPLGGGATVFPDIGLEVAAIRGNAVFFTYSQPTPASLTLHGGSVVTAGEKWIATRWMRERPYL